LPDLDESLTKSTEAASLAKKAGHALKQAEESSAVARAIREAAIVARAKVKSNAALVAVAQKNYDEALQQLQHTQSAERSVKHEKQLLEKQWAAAKKHEDAGVMMSAEKMKQESAAKDESTRLRAKLATAEHTYMQLRQQDEHAKHAYHTAAAKAAEAARKAADLAQEANEALKSVDSDPEASSDGASEQAENKSRLSTEQGAAAAELAREAASAGQVATEEAQRVANAHEMMLEAKKQLNEAIAVDETDSTNVKSSIGVAVKAKKGFEHLNKELNGKQGEMAVSHAKALELAAAHSTVDAALAALNDGKAELKAITQKLSQLDARSHEASMHAEAQKAAARATSRAASAASKAAAEMAAHVANHVSADIELAAAAQPQSAEDPKAPSTTSKHKVLRVKTKKTAKRTAKKTAKRTAKKTEIVLGDDDEIASAKREQAYAQSAVFGLDSIQL
jgi:hypothetical protein